MRSVAIVGPIAVFATGCSGGSSDEAEYRRALSCQWALSSRAELYQDQGFSSTPKQMEDRAKLYETEAFVRGGAIGKSQTQVLEDRIALIRERVERAKAATTDQQRQDWLGILNAEADLCFSSEVSAQN